MATPYTRFYEQMQAVVDSINHDADPVTKLSSLQRLHRDLTPMLLRYRDEAAYELRTRYSCIDAERMTGISIKHLNYWANRWRIKNNLPRLRRIAPIDLSGAIDLSGE